ncbi:ParB N-terminal domain-containing protein [Burkholderia vietnamiensis]|uniref:ParB N-terminal domain-containing protein n=1 Tax=Burkholderia vietnamiensis TaxID=60552 RepID=UPI001B9903BC|nr:ParB N-terminal domain-containing protein [Burkholderia vietnamiensis]MBR8005602.1 ParB N-terminal domain-containing protein [Burkholderia vietnamiensis]
MKGKEINVVNVASLKFDPANPRLPENVERDQQSMLDYIAESTAIEDLMGAIAENDFFPGEPVIVVPSDVQGEYLVVEGNRRLGAVLLLQDPTRCSRPTARMKEISAGAKHRPDAIPVIVCATREEVLPYLGFRHITGVKEWDPLAKARYVLQLFEMTKAVNADEGYKEVARAIGSRKDYIKRNLDALAVYRVIEQNGFYGIGDLNEETIKFSVLSTALADDRIGEFVGVSSKEDDGTYSSSDPIVNPEALKAQEVKELTAWLYEKDGKGRTRVGESRNLRQLAAVVDTPRALAEFRKGASLRYSYQLTSSIAQEFMEYLYQAESATTEAAALVASMQYDEEAITVARRVFSTIRLIGNTLKEKKTLADDDQF